MLNFKDIQIEDYNILTEYFKISKYNSCEYCFGNLFMWKERFHSRYAIAEDMLFIKGCFDKNCYYLMPSGNVDLEKAFEILIQDAKDCNHKFILHCITAPVKEKITELFPHLFKWSTSNNTYDYVYLREDLAKLSGRKFHAKRNFVNRFLSENKNFDFEEITKENINLCYDLSKQWLEENKENINPSMINEKDAIKKCLDNFFKINMKGAILKANGKICAFTAGEHLNESTFTTHIEKASYDVVGSFAVINQEFARQCLKDYTYIDREEDMGIEGLRKAKKSYNPVFMIEKYTATKEELGVRN